MTKQARTPNLAYRHDFGKRLQALRAEAGFSQEALAHASGVSRRYLSGIERGEANPSLDQIVRLAETIRVEPAELMPPRTGRS